MAKTRIVVGFGLIHKHIMESYLSIQAKAIYAYLSSLTGTDKDYCFPGLEKISAAMKISKRMIIKYLKELIESGLIEKQRRFGNSNAYTLNYESDKIFRKNSEAQFTLDQPICEAQFTTVVKHSSPQLCNVVQPNNNRLTITDNNNSINLEKEKNNKKEKEDCKEVISYLNEKAKKNYRNNIDSTNKLIFARFRNGFTLDDFKTVIDNKVKEWGNDPKMSAYLRPQTLFGTKFEAYLNQAPKKKVSKYQDIYDEIEREQTG